MTQQDELRPWHVRSGKLPVIALTIHCGHELRPEVAALSALCEAERTREEDPHTERLCPSDATRIIVSSSRFEVDLNREREKAVYRQPEDAWGLDLWNAPLPLSVIRDSLSIYDRFYTELDRLIQKQIHLHDRVLLLDMHSYNYRRKGPHAPAQPQQKNPEINLGTAPLAGKWPAVTRRFIDELSGLEFLGGSLDVRENIRFKGGHLCRHVMQHFGQNACPLAIEVKKFFMDEWSGRVYEERVETLNRAFNQILPGLLDAMNR